MKTLKLLVIAILALSFAACSNDDDNETQRNNGAVTFTTSIGGTVSPSAKASGTSWGQGDAIGVYMKTGAGLSSIVDGGANKKYTTPGTGAFSPANVATDALYYPKNGSNVDFIAYYPYVGTLSNNTFSVDVANQSSQEAIDLLYSNNATGYNKNSATATLNFEHQLAKIVFNINAGAGITSLANLKLTLAGTSTKADFALDAKVLNVVSSTADIALKTTVSGTQAVSEGIILPAAGTIGRVVSFATAQGVFKWEIPATTAFEAGKKYTYNVELKLGGELGVYPNGTITDWGVGSSEDITLDLDGDNEGDGTQTSPYTVAQALSKNGESTKWVTGYIVGSTSKTKAFGAVNTNILLAEKADETDESKCIPVDIAGSAVQANLDIVANSDLIGKVVKVQGNIVNNIFGGVVAITTVIAQEGGKEASGGGTPVEFFFENFGPDDVKYSNPRPKVATHTDWLMKAPIVYSDASGFIDLRTTSTINPSAWLPALKDCGFLIEGIESGYTGMTLSYDIAAGSGTGNTEANVVKVFCNGTEVSVPSTLLEKTNEYATINISIPDNTTSIEFKMSSTTTVGFRLDNVKIKGVK